MTRSVNMEPRQDFEISCPSCGSLDVSTEMHPHTFEYLDGTHTVDVTAVVPYRTCKTCDFQFTDEAAEDARHEAVCTALGLLTPKEIRSIRERYGVSRERFAEITRIGNATIGRWERGALLQNAANDQYLRLISRPEVFALLSRPSGAPDVQPTGDVTALSLKERFRSVREPRRAKADASVFMLRAS
jgi:putative zinc finger/helix-turn-helix YgiT family protein